MRELTGGGRSRALQLAGSLSRYWGEVPLLGPTFLNVGYTWTDSHATVGSLDGPFRFGTTAGDPASMDWAPDGSMPRHMWFATASMSLSPRASLSIRGRVSTGLPFTPMVTGDVNGDGSGNDRAYIFSPHEAAAGEEVAAGMARLMEEAPGSVRDCLSAQVGRIAGHNSCRTGWSSNLDLHARISLGPRMERSGQRRLTLWVAASNLTAAADYLVHGPEGARGWGQPASVDETLLTVRGFDPAARRFRYDVNPRFGRPSAFSVRVPFALSLQLRVVVGVDRPLAAYNEARDEAANRAAALAPANLQRHLRNELRNFPEQVLALNGPGKLYLEPHQARRLQQAADSLSTEIDHMVAAFVSAITVAPGAEVEDLNRYRSLANAALALQNAGLEITRSTLSPEQWGKLPRRLRTVRRRFAPLPVASVSGGADN